MAAAAAAAAAALMETTNPSRGIACQWPGRPGAGFPSRFAAVLEAQTLKKALAAETLVKIPPAAGAPSRERDAS